MTTVCDVWWSSVSISSVAEWLISEVPPSGEIGFDPFLFSLGTSLYSPSLLSVQVTINKVLAQVGGKLLMGLPDATQTVDLWLIRFSVCNDLQFPPLETQENYNINLDSSNRSLKSIPANLVDQVWKERPSIPPDSLTRLPDRVISGFPCVCVCTAPPHTHCSLLVCLCGALYLCADKYLQTDSNRRFHKHSIKEPVYVFMAGWQIKY